MPAINGSKGWYILLASIVASLTGSGSGVYIYMKNITPHELQKIARPDPATGSELRALSRDLQYHLNNHPDIINKFDRRLTRLETKMDMLLDRTK